MFNQLRIKEKHGLYYIQYFGGWLIKHWKNLQQYQFGDPAIYSFDLLPRPVCFRNKQDADKYLKHHLTETPLNDIQTNIYFSNGNVRLISYYDGKLFTCHLEEKQPYDNIWMSVSTWEFNDKYPFSDVEKHKLLNSTQQHIRNYDEYQYIRYVVRENHPAG